MAKVKKIMGLQIEIPCEKGQVTTDVNGDAILIFSTPFEAKPVVQLTPEYDPGADRVIVQIASWVMDGADYTGCVIKPSDDGGKDEGGVVVHYCVM